MIQKQRKNFIPWALIQCNMIQQDKSSRLLFNLVVMEPIEFIQLTIMHLFILFIYFYKFEPG